MAKSGDILVVAALQGKGDATGTWRGEARTLLDILQGTGEPSQHRITWLRVNRAKAEAPDLRAPGQVL